MMPMQKQYGSTYCGIFAIAVMTSLAHEEDPSRFKYIQVQANGIEAIPIGLHYKRKICVLSKQ